MKQLYMRELTTDAFLPYGRFASLSSPGGPALGESPIRFFRDLLPLGSGQALSASVTQVDAMPLTVDTMEFHTDTWEAFVSLDSDSCICVAPATASRQLDVDTLEAFRVPAGTMIYLHRGVWHYAPYPLGSPVLHSLVILPERTYANDCEKIAIADPCVIVENA